MSSKTRVAVVGGGVSGIVAAHNLQDICDVTIFEKGPQIGGHTCTIAVEESGGKEIGVDIGFIVCNDRTYPNFHRFLSDLGVKVRSADMSFSFSCERSGLAYCSRNIRTLFAQKKNLISPRFLGMLLKTLSFWRAANSELLSGNYSRDRLGDWLNFHGLTGPIADDYILPISAAMWSSPDADILAFPVETFLKFFKNHGLLSYFQQPQWQTVVGGSSTYLRAFKQRFSGRIKVDSEITGISRTPNAVQIKDKNGEVESFDHVIIATHADHSLKLLDDPTSREREILLPWRYHKNRTVLHTDISLLPEQRNVWASWNYRRSISSERTTPVAITYYMNLLQGFSASRDYCVTLNPDREIPQSKIIADVEFEHPCFTLDAVSGIKQISDIQGVHRTWFCGSYHGFGFHEDGVKAGKHVSDCLRERVANGDRNL